MIIGKTIALTIWTFVGKVLSLLCNTLSRFVIAFLPRIKHLLISWLQSLSAVILEPKKIKSINASTFSPSICYKVMGPDAMILVFLMLSQTAQFKSVAYRLWEWGTERTLRSNIKQGTHNQSYIPLTFNIMKDPIFRKSERVENGFFVCLRFKKFFYSRFLLPRNSQGKSTDRWLVKALKSHLCLFESLNQCHSKYGP